MMTLNFLTEHDAGTLMWRLMDLRDGLDNGHARARTSRMIARVALFISRCAAGQDIHWQWRIR